MKAQIPIICLIALAAPVIASGQEVVSQSASSSSSAASSIDPAQDVIWTFPNADRYIGEYNPLAPLDKPVNGIAQIRCGWIPSGRVVNCVIISESPAGYGFGNATVRLFQQRAIVKMKDRSPVVTAGEGLKITMRWNMGS